MERREYRVRRAFLFIASVCVIILIGSESDTSRGGLGLLSAMPGIVRTKRIMFVGYRPHWNQTLPYRCSCGTGLELSVNSSKGPKYSADDITGADLVIFALGARLNQTQWRTHHELRPSEQRWMLATRESALSARSMNPPEEYRFNSFHWSYTYGTSANFPSPYGRYIEAPKALRSPGAVDWSENKTRLLSWTSSHCPLPDWRWHRRDFVNHLRQHIPVDMFGKCGHLSCPKRTEKCFHKLINYKFALALENSCCKDYISEKFWKALSRYNQVPIVFGAKREEYEKVAPPNSFIFIEDFSSLEELADYLHMLDNNVTLYNAYHQWRNHGRVKMAKLPNDLIFHCDALCRVASQLDNPAPEWNAFTFDPYGEDWFGGCRSCSDAIGRVLGEEER